MELLTGIVMSCGLNFLVATVGNQCRYLCIGVDFRACIIIWYGWLSKEKVISVCEIVVEFKVVSSRHCVVSSDEVLRGEA